MRRLVAAASALVVAFALFGCEGGPSEGNESAANSPSETAGPFDQLPVPVRAFLDNDSEHPFGEPGENAPPENDFFAALVGVWSCRLRFGARYAFPSTWAFKYSAGGFAIEHLYYQREADLVPPFASIERDFHSLAITLHDPAEQAWKFVSVSNLAGTDIAPASQAMTGQVEDDVLILEPDAQQDELYSRDTFHDIEADKFVWTQYESRDQGATCRSGIDRVPAQDLIGFTCHACPVVDLAEPDVEQEVIAALRQHGASFGFVFGSQARGDQRPDSDVDVAAWWPGDPPGSYDVPLPSGVDLLVLNNAPLELAGRIAVEGRLLFDDDQVARVRWTAMTRKIYFDELPRLTRAHREFAESIRRGG